MMPEILSASHRTPVVGAMHEASTQDALQSNRIADCLTGAVSDSTHYVEVRGTVSDRAGSSLSVEDRQRIAHGLVTERVRELMENRSADGSERGRSTPVAQERALHGVHTTFELKSRSAQQALAALIDGDAKVLQSVESADVSPAARRRLQNIATMLDVARRSGVQAQECDALAKQVRDLVLSKGLGSNSPFAGYNGKGNGSTRLSEIEDEVSKLVTKEAFQREVGHVSARVAAAQADYVEARLGGALDGPRRQAIIDNGGIISERAKAALQALVHNWNEHSGMNRVFLLEILLDAERLQRALDVPAREPAAHGVADADGERAGPQTDGRHGGVRAGEVSPGGVRAGEVSPGGVRAGEVSPYGPYNKIVFSPTITVSCGGASEGPQHVGTADGLVSPMKPGGNDDSHDATSITATRQENEFEDRDQWSEPVLGDRNGDSDRDDDRSYDGGSVSRMKWDREFRTSSDVGTQTDFADVQRREVGTQTEPLSGPNAHPDANTLAKPTLASQFTFARIFSTVPHTHGPVFSMPYRPLLPSFAAPLPPRTGVDQYDGFALRHSGSYLELADLDPVVTTQRFLRENRYNVAVPKPFESAVDGHARHKPAGAEDERSKSPDGMSGANGAQGKEDWQRTPASPHDEGGADKRVGPHPDDNTPPIVNKQDSRAVLRHWKELVGPAPSLGRGFAHEHTGSYLNKNLGKVVTTEGYGRVGG
ncbi:hypothetical protein [Burkholderia dolosa]|uniref:hypothetical protein n=1 Tax=Burkholderia dolosa TaxID=152500 RepID=UPI001BA5633B|nr:hypothetical protein [Burkholderia dolosa]